MSSRRRTRVVSAVAGTGLVAALAPWGVSAANAWSSDAAEADPAVALAPQEVAPQVVLVQRVAPQVTIESLTDERISAKGGDLVAISTTGSYDVPDVAMRAYKRAAASMQSIRPECQIPWTLLAGVGRVESDHGRYGGSVLGADGLPRPAIRGVALNGVGPVAAIADSDDGRWDDDPVWDRAVGPMQFIPTTWDSAGRDGDADGVADPNDIDDAALAAADYLCPSSGSILSDGALDAAIFSYNHSDYYVALVRAFMTGYETGVFDLPTPPAPPATEEPGDKKDEEDRKKNDDKAETEGATRDERDEPADRGGPSAPSKSPTKAPTSSPTKAPTKTPTKPKPPAPTATTSPTTPTSPTSPAPTDGAAGTTQTSSGTATAP